VDVAAIPVIVVMIMVVSTALGTRLFATCSLFAAIIVVMWLGGFDEMVVNRAQILEGAGNEGPNPVDDGLEGSDEPVAFGLFGGFSLLLFWERAAVAGTGVIVLVCKPHIGSGVGGFERLDRLNLH
jgi:hypothetical protein